MAFDTKIKVILRDDLELWQKLNVTAFVVSGIAGTQDVIGEIYRDGSGIEYLPMIKQPIMIHSANGEQIKNILSKAKEREMQVAIYTKELFSTLNDDDNREEVAKHKTEDLDLVGIGLLGKKSQLDRITKGIPMHK